MENIEDEVKQLIAGILEVEPEKIAPDVRLVEDLGMDSMMALEILVSVEKRYHIKIPEEKLSKITSLKGAVALVKEYLSS